MDLRLLPSVCEHALVVLDAVARRNLRIAPAVILNQLAAAIEERLQIRIERVDRAVVGIIGMAQIGFEVEAIDLPFGSLNTR